MEPFDIAPQTGGTLPVENVIGRDDFILSALRDLRAGNDLLILDPRRIGKTSTLRRLCNEPGEGVLAAVHVSYEGVSTEEEFLERTINALRSHSGLWTKIQKTVQQFVEVESGGPVRVKVSLPNRSATQILADLALAIDEKLGPDSLLIVAQDEVPVGIDNIAEKEGPEAARLMLRKMRELRQSTVNVRWIVTGSIGFHHVIRHTGSTTGVLNDLAPRRLGPLDDDEAVLLGRCLLLGIHSTDDQVVARALAQVCGRFPFVMHNVANELSKQQSGITVDDVEAAFVHFASDRDSSLAFTHIIERVPAYSELAGIPSKAIFAVLDLVARQEHVDDSDVRALIGDFVDGDTELVQTVLDCVVDDHYLTGRADTGWTWRYDVVRRVWAIRRSLG